MHDVTKRGLALAVATGGLLITGAAPAVSAVSTHPEHPGHAGTKSQPTGDSSHHAAIPVSAPKVKQYTGRHKASEQPAATPHQTAASHAPASHHSPGHHSPQHHGPEAHHAAPAQHAAAPHHTAAPHQAPAQHGAAPHHATAPHHSTAPHHAAAPHHTGTAAHSAPATLQAAGTAAHLPTHAAYPAYPAHPGGDRPAAAEAESSDFGGGGLLAGNTVEVPIDAPVNVCGVVLTVLGGGDSAEDEHCVNGPGTAGGTSSSASAVAAGNPGALSGNVVQVPVSLPTNICGDTATVIGGHDSAEDILCANEGGDSSSTARAVAASSPGLVSGNVVQVPVDAPLNVCGITANVVAVYDTAAGNTCVNGGEHGEHGTGHGYGPTHAGSMGAPGMPRQSAGAGANAVTANSNGAVTGNIVQVPIEAPIDACGDSVSVVGAFNSALDNHCVNHTAGGAAANGHAVGNNGLATGNVAQLPIDIPTEVCGVVAAVGGYHDTAEGNSCLTTGAPTTTSVADTAGETGIVSGNVAQGSVNAPIHACGTTVGAGYVNSGTEDTDCVTGPPPCPPPPPCSSFPPPPPPPPVFPPPPPPVFPPPPPPPPVFPPPPPPPPVTPPPPPVTPPGQHHHHHHHEHHQEHRHRHHAHENAHHEETGQLPHTGTDVLDYAGIGAGAMVLGAGALIAARRKSGSAS